MSPRSKNYRAILGSYIIYRSVRICTWKSSKLGSGRKAYFLTKLRRFFVICSSRPESNLELVPSWDQDDLVTKNKGRQRASKSRMIFHIMRPHIQYELIKQKNWVVFRTIVRHTGRYWVTNWIEPRTKMNWVTLILSRDSNFFIFTKREKFSHYGNFSHNGKFGHFGMFGPYG